MSARLISTAGFISVIPGAIATPVPLSATKLQVATVVIKAFRNRAVNTGNVYLGIAATNDTQTFPLTPGQELRLEAPEDTLIDLSKIYVDAATVTDGVCVSYVLPPIR